MSSNSFSLPKHLTLLLLSLLLLALSCKADTWDDYYQGLYEYHQGLNDYFHEIGAYYQRQKQYQTSDEEKKPTDKPVDKLAKTTSSSKTDKSA